MEADNLTQPTVEVPQKVNKKNGFLISLLSILLLLACIIAGFFAWQTQKLVKELVEQRNLVTPSPMSTPTAGPTADWKTYKDEKFGFSFEYPQTWKITEYNPVNNIHETRIISGKYKIEILRYIGPEPCYFDDYKPSKKDKLDMPTFVTINTYDTYRSINNPNHLIRRAIGSEYLTNSDNENVWKICIFNNLLGSFNTSPLNQNNSISAIRYYTPKNPDDAEIKTLDQILSTFKFAEPKSSSSPVACTEEAKICPNGSSVGRIGPNCEFAKCPATSPQP